ncbi:hypothetical protein O7626_24695 [Micromonospora sp. WMMD1102]|uniref:hypothetical protein n=1 Tax=Micromonospora sp. WMMD1102 TaxID=3016105 RepID=UPI002414FE36|nr:hypothetical protein [Micromonospora sp. WMMD1102]MDG4789091.1 hypothetical protein [Micromonospora sp. WMMD1102]
MIHPDQPRSSQPADEHLISHVRVKDLPATLRPPDQRTAARSTFTVSLWLSNYSAPEAIDLLTRLSAQRAPVG